MCLLERARARDTERTVSIREGNWNTDTDPCKTRPCEDRSRNDAVTSQGCLGPPEAGRGREHPALDPSEGAQPYHSWVSSGLQNRENTFPLFEATQFVGLCYGCPGKLTRQQTASLSTARGLGNKAGLRNHKRPVEPKDM